MNIRTLILALTLLASPDFSQSKKYVEYMKKNIALLDSSKTEAQFLAAAMGFEKMAKTEKKEWLPDYYAGLCYIHIAFEKESADIDKWADKADICINRADSLSKNNAEIYVLKAMSASSRIMVDPMSRGFQYGKAAYDYSQTAMALDPTNPRPFANKAQGAFYTPEAFGGGAAKAKPNVEKALALYKTFRPASELHPNWGKAMCEDLLKKCSEN